MAARNTDSVSSFIVFGEQFVKEAGSAMTSRYGTGYDF
jgi:hypothetical protein